MINIALPKGRLGRKIAVLLSEAGYDFPGLLDDTRRLVFVNEAEDMRVFWVKPFDVPVYVERGAADIGVCGKDILMELKPDVYEIADLETGICSLCVAAMSGFSDDGVKTLRVATEFPNAAREYYASMSREIDIITLRGSVELAPLLGLSDVIVDIVETGTTLRENSLEVIATIARISARMTVNKSSYKFKGERINEMLRRFSL